MTAETDLLPLPYPHWIGMDTCDAPGPRHYTADQMQAYARACVSSATEALRAEVGETKEVAVRAMRQRDAQYNRAERLAEALRLISKQGTHYGPDGTRESWQHWAEIARAALDQETTNG